MTPRGAATPGCRDGTLAVAKTLVIGYGNTLRGDDGVGPYVASQFGPNAIACPQLVPELAEPISRAEHVIFVDAHLEVPPGEIAIRPVEPAPSASFHRYAPESLLAWSHQLYGHSPQAIMIGLGVESFALRQGLSPAAKRAARHAVRIIRKIHSAFPPGRC